MAPEQRAALNNLSAPELIAVIKSEIDKIEPYIIQLESDKRRLDWLEKNKQGIEMLAGHFRICRWDVDYPDNDIRNTNIRAAIDEAMKGDSSK